MPLGSLISGGLNLLGGVLGQQSSDFQAEQNRALQIAFAKRAIGWKVADARKAGIHPLYALGAPTSSYQPFSVGTPLGDAVSSMGQDLGRAADAVASASERAMNKQAQVLQLKRMGLENMILEQRIAAGNQPVVPASPGTVDMSTSGGLPGQGDVKSMSDFLGGPEVAKVKGPSPNVEVVKFGGYPLVRDPKLFSSGDVAQQEFGESAEHIIGIPAILEALKRAVWKDLSGRKLLPSEKDLMERFGYWGRPK